MSKLRVDPSDGSVSIDAAADYKETLLMPSVKVFDVTVQLISLNLILLLNTRLFKVGQNNLRIA